MIKTNWFQVGSILLCIFLGFCILASYSPAAWPVPANDPGVYYYIGRGILNDGLPYRDFWDHKGPVIHYLSAFGLSMIDVSYWGPWMLEFFSIGASVIVGFFIAMRLFDELTATLGSLFWLFGFNVLYTGYCVEEFVLPLYFLQMILFFSTGGQPPVFLKLFVIGLLGGISFLVRPNLISPFLSISLVFVMDAIKFYGQHKHQDCLSSLRRLIILFFGFIIVAVLTILFFVSQGAGREFYRDVFLYNILYSANELSRWNTFILGVKFLWLPFALALLGWLLGMKYLFNAKKQENTLHRNFILFALLAFPLEIGLSIISGYLYGHYFISWLPVMSLLIGFGFFYISKTKPQFLVWKTRLVVVCFSLIGVMIISRNRQSLFLFANDVVHSGGRFSVDYKRFPEWSLAERVLEIAGKDRTILFWGNEVQYNFAMNYAAPSRYMYLAPFLIREYVEQPMVDEFYLDIVSNKPVIVDVRPSTTASLEAPNKWAREYIQLYPVVSYIYQNYEIVERLDAMPIMNLQGDVQIRMRDEWVIWDYKNEK